MKMQTDNLTEFVRESNRIEGIIRHPTSDEVEAHAKFLAGPTDVLALERLVDVLQPGAELRIRAGMNVRVGNHRPPEGGPHIVAELVRILRAGSADGAYRQHHRYETLHPFMDGNGRSGRALWLKTMGYYPIGIGFLHMWYYQSLQNRRA